MKAVFRVCAAVAVLLSFAAVSDAHIARDASAHSKACSNSSCTVPLTVGTGAHNFVWLVATCNGCHITSVVDRTSGAKLACKAATDSRHHVRTFACWTVGVPSGPNSFLIRLSGALKTAEFRANISSYTGVNQSSPFDVFPTVYIALGRATSVSESVTTKLPNDWIIDGVSLLMDSQTNLVSGTSDKGPIPTPVTIRDRWTSPIAAIWATFTVAALRSDESAQLNNGTLRADGTSLAARPALAQSDSL